MIFRYTKDLTKSFIIFRKFVMKSFILEIYIKKLI